MMWVDAIAALPWLALLLLGWRRWQQRRVRLQGRLGALAAVPDMPRWAGWRPWLAAAGNSRMAGWQVDAAQAAALRQQLYAAGFAAPDAPALFLAGKLALALGAVLLVLLAWLGLALPALLALFLLPAGLAAALKLPDQWLQRRANRRRAAIEQGLPDMLDVLLVCGEAGIGLEQGLERAAHELQPLHPALAQELAVTVSEMRLLPDRLAGLANMAERLMLDSVRTLATTLVQSMRYGTPLAAALRSLAADLRLVRQTRMEASAARLPVLITLPMVMFILPATVLVVAGPALLQLAGALGAMAQ